MKNSETWTRAHDLALVYIALAYGTDFELADTELAVLTDALQRWREHFDTRDVQEVVLEAMAIFMEEDASAEVSRSVHGLKDLLDHDERCRALEDAVRIAEADGVLLSSEQGLISMIADAWELKATGMRLLEETTATRQDRPAWSLMHDVVMMYLIVAHSSDSDLSEQEIDAMQERLQDWEPGLSVEEIRSVVREALQLYAKEPDEEMLRQSIFSIRDVMPLVQRLAVLNDLVYIAEADGSITETERELIGSLARHWNLDVRLNGQDTSV